MERTKSISELVRLYNTWGSLLNDDQHKEVEFYLRTPLYYNVHTTEILIQMIENYLTCERDRLILEIEKLGIPPLASTPEE